MAIIECFYSICCRILKLRSNGLIDGWSRRHFPRPRVCADHHQVVFGVSDVIGVFVVLAMGVCVAFLVLVMEIFYNKTKIPLRWEVDQGK